jgi:hypothetical protein
VSALAFFIAWANVPFAIAAGVAALFVVLQLTGVLGLLAGHGDADDGGGHEADANADADADADADGDSEEQDHAHAAGHAGLAAVALGVVGVGRIPLSIIWQTFCLAFAGAGYALNWHYWSQGQSPPVYTLAWTGPCSLTLGYLAVAAVARLLGPILSSRGQEATSRAELVGQMGIVISSRVDRDFGEIRIRDKTGHDLRVVCKLARGATAIAKEKQSVVVVEYEPEKGELFVEPLEDEVLGDRQNRAG